jgi:hypothetical protein
MRVTNVMLSYSGSDIDHMTEVAQHLHTKGIDPWMIAKG